MTISETLAALAPCPWCGSELVRSSGQFNKVAFCEIAGCWMAERKMSIALDDSVQIDQWNTRTGQLVPVPSVERVSPVIAEKFAGMFAPDMANQLGVEIATAVIAAMKEPTDDR